MRRLDKLLLLAQDRAGGPQPGRDKYHVKTPDQVSIGAPGRHVKRRRPQQPLLLTWAQCLERRVVIGARLHFDKGDEAAARSNDVDFPGMGFVAAGANAIALQEEPETGEPFGAMAQTMRLLTARLSTPGRRHLSRARPTWTRRAHRCRDAAGPSWKRLRRQHLSG